MLSQRFARVAAALIAALLIIFGAAWATGRLPEGFLGGRGYDPEVDGPARPAPNVTLLDPSRKKHALEEFRGNIVLVHFWASWCPPCVPELPEFLAVGKAFEGKKLKLLAISTDERWEDAAKIIPGEIPSNASLLWDPESEAADRFGSYVFPETYVLDDELRVVAKWVGPQDWGGPMMAQFLERALTLMKD